MPHPIRHTIAISSALVTLTAAGCLATPTPNHPTGQRLHVVMLLPPRAALSPLSDDAFKLSRLGVAEALTTLDADGTPQPSLAVSWSRTDDRT